MHAPTSESTLSTFTAHDGDNIAVQDWPLPAGVPVRGVVMLVHGLGEHAGRYAELAEQLNEWGFAVRGHDQHGHGESGGQPGCIPGDMRLLDDLADIIDSTRLRMDDHMPLILLGHSMGGVVAARFVAMGKRPVDGLVLSSPSLRVRMTASQRMLVRAMNALAPNFCVSNGIDPNWLSHDMAVVHAYRNDPRVHDRISARLATFIAESGQEVLACAPRWQVPTLLMYSAADRIIDPAACRAFAEAAPAEAVTTRCFEDLYHELFFEKDRAMLYNMLHQWLHQVIDARQQD